MRRHRSVARLSRLLDFGLGLAQAALICDSFARYQCLPQLDSLVSSADESNIGPGPEAVSVVVPARNERSRILPLLDSLQSSREWGCQIVIVDDGSTDGTGDVVRSAGFECVPAHAPPDGWTGKSWACHRGAESTQGTWILFLDSDISLDDGAIEYMVRVAERRKLSMLSVFLQHRCLSFWEKVLLPYMFAVYFAGGGGSRVNTNPTSPLANGQCLLVKRSDYIAVGGHTSVRESITDDIALAAVFLRSGLNVLAVRGENWGRVRMYDNFTAIREGFGKNAGAFTIGLGPTAMRTIAMSMISVGMAVRLLRRPSLSTVGSWLSCAALLSRWYRRFGVHPVYALFHPLAALTAQVIVFDGVARRVAGRTTWKGRLIG